MDLDAGPDPAQPVLTIGALSARSGVAASAIRFYEARGLIRSLRSGGGQRRYARGTLRRIAFVRVAQQVGLSLDEIREALSGLPEERTPTAEDWRVLAAAWRPRIDRRIGLLQRLRDQLDGCIGCGCLSLAHCGLANPGDVAGRRGAGPRYLLGGAAAGAGGEAGPPE